MLRYEIFIETFCFRLDLVGIPFANMKTLLFEWVAFKDESNNWFGNLQCSVGDC